jgi:hypothetical protein
MDCRRPSPAPCKYGHAKACWLFYWARQSVVKVLCRWEPKMQSAPAYWGDLLGMLVEMLLVTKQHKHNKLLYGNCYVPSTLSPRKRGKCPRHTWMPRVALGNLSHGIQHLALDIHEVICTWTYVEGIPWLSTNVCARQTIYHVDMYVKGWVVSKAWPRGTTCTS